MKSRFIACLPLLALPPIFSAQDMSEIPFAVQRQVDRLATIYGYGWFVGGPLSIHQGLREVGHGGDVQGFASALYALPEKQFAVVVLSNGEKPKASLDYINLARDIYDVTYGK